MRDLPIKQRMKIARIMVPVTAALGKLRTDADDWDGLVLVGRLVDETIRIVVRIQVGAVEPETRKESQGRGGEKEGR